MTPKEKANEFIGKFKEAAKNQIFAEWGYYHKACALLMVDEVIGALESFGYAAAMYKDFESSKLITTGEKSPTEYWYEVKKEIEKLEL